MLLNSNRGSKTLFIYFNRKTRCCDLFICIKCRVENCEFIKFAVNGVELKKGSCKMAHNLIY